MKAPYKIRTLDKKLVEDSIKLHKWLTGSVNEPMPLTKEEAVNVMKFLERMRLGEQGVN